MDYGQAGIRETLRHLLAMKRLGLKAYAGLGVNRRRASRTELIKVKSGNFGFAAIGIASDYRGYGNHSMQMDFNSAADLRLVLEHFRRARADFRILSIHHGIEGLSIVDGEDIALWLQAVERGNAALVAGHHAHVPRAVAIHKGSVIFFGLGNFLHDGTADLTNLGLCS